MPKIETARLRLRKFTPDDLDDLARLFSNEEVMRYLGIEAGQTYSREETKPILNNFIEDWRRYGFSRWAVIHKESGQFIGFCGLRMLDGMPELIYVLAKAYWGKRLAAEAAKASLRYSFEELKLERIVAITRHENVASQRVMQSIGMSNEREVRYYGIEGVAYEILREDFHAGDSLYILHRE